MYSNFLARTEIDKLRHGKTLPLVEHRFLFTPAGSFFRYHDRVGIFESLSFCLSLNISA
jgi:hypothetical protein